MLFTRCPDCQTNFRITADALRKADGQVRCGHCSAVFNAYEELRDGNGSVQPRLAAEETAEEEFDSLSETDEYIAMEDDQPAESTTEPVSHQTVSEETELATPAAPGPSAENSDDSAQEDTELAPTTESSLEFDLPPDEWTTFFQHAVEHSLADDLPEGGGAAQPVQAEPADPQDGKRSMEDIVIGEVSDELVEVEEAAIRESVLESDSTEEGASRIITVPESEAAVAQLAEAIADSEVVQETPAIVEEVEWVGDADLELSDERARDEDAVVDIIAGDRAEARYPFWQSLESRRWSVGSALFSALLLAQFVHYFRAPLAGQPLVGPLVRAGYAVAGAEIVPELDLTQYEIMDWVATANVGTGEPGSLHISAQIHNRGPRAQPYPNIRLELKDRWEATVGSRVFTAGEYLPKDVAQDRVMEAGSTVPAALEVVDPGQDAYGFELDICAELDGGGLRCASDTVFR